MPSHQYDSELDDGPLHGHLDLHSRVGTQAVGEGQRPRRRCGQRVVVEQGHPLGARPLGEAPRRTRRRRGRRRPGPAARPPCTGRRGAGGRRRRPGPAPPRGTAPSRRGRGRGRSGRGRRGRPASCGRRYAVAEGSATGVRDLPGQHPEALEVVLALVDHAERPLAPELVGRDREERRPHARRQEAERIVGPGGAAARAPRRRGGRRPRRTAGPACGPSGGGRTGASRGTARPRAARTAGAARCHRPARGSAARRRRGRWPRTRCGRRRPRTRAPRAGVEPRTPHRCDPHSAAVSALPGGGRRPARPAGRGRSGRRRATATRHARHRPQRGRAAAAFEHGPLAEHRARGRSRRARSPSTSTASTPSSSTNRSVARARPARPAPSPAFSCLISGLAPSRMTLVDSSRSSADSTCGHERRRVQRRPTACACRRRGGPVLEVGQPALGGELAVVAVDPVPRERAGARPAGPGCGRRRGSSAARSSRRSARGTGRTAGAATGRGSGHAGPAAGRLREAHPAVADLGLGSWRSGSDDGRHGDGADAEVARWWRRSRRRPSTRGRRTRPSSTSIQACSRLAKRKPSFAAQLLERRRSGAADVVGRRSVVVGDAHAGAELGRPGERLGRDPRDGGDGPLDPHGPMMRPLPWRGQGAARWSRGGAGTTCAPEACCTITSRGRGAPWPPCGRGGPSPRAGRRSRPGRSGGRGPARGGCC